ncbi:hypothetical protein MRX96_007596 [Rhipicephalus microplus]
MISYCFLVIVRRNVGIKDCLMMTRSWIYADKQTHRCAGRRQGERRTVLSGEPSAKAARFDVGRLRTNAKTVSASAQSEPPLSGSPGNKSEHCGRPSAEQRHRLEAESAHKSRQTLRNTEAAPQASEAEGYRCECQGMNADSARRRGHSFAKR